jgi:hypothetical protein
MSRPVQFSLIAMTIAVLLGGAAFWIDASAGYSYTYVRVTRSKPDPAKIVRPGRHTNSAGVRTAVMVAFKDGELAGPVEADQAFAWGTCLHAVVRRGRLTGRLLEVVNVGDRADGSCE